MSRLTVATCISASMLLSVLAPTAFAHPGGTDDNGCHTCRSDCEKWGETPGEKHCHGDEPDDPSASNSDSTAKEGDGSVPVSKLEADEKARVVEAVDGDTLTVRLPRLEGRRIDVRVLGIDCPESHKNSKCKRDGDCESDIPKGKEAARKVSELVEGEVVRLEPGADGFETGGYDRLLAYIRTNKGRDMGLYLVKKGLCSDFGHKYPHKRGETYRKAEPN